jgi:predicted metal-dependent HD superfamily phosphohydrolase
MQRLERELSPNYLYHSIEHTRDDVLIAAERLARMENVGGEDLLCLRTAVCFHDIGYIDRPDDHEERSAQIADDVLPRFGYSPAQTALIHQLIIATRLPTNPQSLLEAIIVDADLDSLGRDDFLRVSLNLRRELNAQGVNPTDEAWFKRQVDFLQAHRYYTTSAQTLRAEGKRRNLELVRKLFADAQRAANQQDAQT